MVESVDSLPAKRQRGRSMRTTQPFDPNFGASRSKTLCGSPVREVFDHVLDSIVHETRTSAKDGRSSAEVSASG